MTALVDHRSLDPAADWPFFDESFCLSAEVRDVVQPLTSEASASFWRAHISDKPYERHPMLLPNGHWLTPTLSGPEWLHEFNDSSPSPLPTAGAVEKFLRDSFKVSEQDELFYIAMREHAYRMPFWAAMKCWTCLVAIDDEGSILFHPASGKFACFGPNGTLTFGRKSSHDSVDAV